MACHRNAAKIIEHIINYYPPRSRDCGHYPRGKTRGGVSKWHKRDIINNRIARRCAIFTSARIYNVAGAFSTPILHGIKSREGEARRRGSLLLREVSQESGLATRYVSHVRDCHARTSAVCNKRAELIANLGHARVKSFVAVRYVPTRCCAKSQTRLAAIPRAANRTVRFVASLMLSELTP